MNNNLYAIFPILNSTQNQDLIIEMLKSSPAWIALIISLVVPFITKKLEIEKANKFFIFKEKYHIYSIHFEKLHSFNESIKKVLVTLGLCLSSEADTPECSDLSQNISEMHSTWNEIKYAEAKLWLVAKEEVLKNRNVLLASVSSFNKSLNTIDLNSEIITKEKLMELVSLAEKIQDPLSQYIKFYREEFENLK